MVTGEVLPHHVTVVTAHHVLGVYRHKVIVPLPHGWVLLSPLFLR